MENTTTDQVEAAAIVCPPETLSNLRALVQLGVLYSMERLMCPNQDCNGCQDRMMEMYRALATIGQDEGPFMFEWGRNAIELIVRDPVSIAEFAPSIGETIALLEKQGAQVKHELAL